MPRVSTQEGQFCTECGKQPGIYHRRRLINERTGKRDRDGGEFYSCPCGALTLGMSGYNQRAPEERPQRKAA